MFHSAGVDLGRRLLGAEPANPYGHFEDIEVVAMHDRFLARSEQTWKSVGAQDNTLSTTSRADLDHYVDRREATHDPSTPWGVKDPRLCLYLGEWLRVCPEARVVLVIRRPGEAIRSLHNRHSRRHVDLRGADPSDLDFWRDPDLGVKMWIDYHERVLQVIDLADRPLIVDFGDRAALSKLLHIANDHWAELLDVRELVVPDPRLGARSVAPVGVGSMALLEQAGTVWAALRERLNVT